MLDETKTFKSDLGSSFFAIKAEPVMGIHVPTTFTRPYMLPRSNDRVRPSEDKTQTKKELPRSASKNIRVLGLDPGTATTGFACIEEINNQIVINDLGCIQTQKNYSLEERLDELAQDLEKLIQEHHPNSLAIEKIFFAKNVKTGISVAHARGVLIQIGQRNKISIHEYSPNEIKMGICSDGHADKHQMQKMVQLICKLPVPPEPDDAADALAVALYHMQTLKIAYNQKYQDV